jgi:hypothetical protein
MVLLNGKVNCGLSIYECCLGTRNKTGGFKWMYKTDYKNLIMEKLFKELKDVADTIISNGEKEMFWHPETKTLWWTICDSDGDNDFEEWNEVVSKEDFLEWFTTPLKEVEFRFLSLKEVEKLQIEAETYPISFDDPDGTEGWYRVNTR